MYERDVTLGYCSPSLSFALFIDSSHTCSFLSLDEYKKMDIIRGIGIKAAVYCTSARRLLSSTVMVRMPESISRGDLTMNDLVGQQFGEYRLIRFLGSGNFADVYEAEHVHLKTRVAVKLLRGA